METAMQLSDRIGRRMKLQDLHVLMAVAQAGTMLAVAFSFSSSFACPETSHTSASVVESAVSEGGVNITPLAEASARGAGWRDRSRAFRYQHHRRAPNR